MWVPMQQSKDMSQDYNKTYFVLIHLLSVNTCHHDLGLYHKVSMFSLNNVYLYNVVVGITK